ncbi:MAG: hypothetical protein ABSC93_25735 [Bryobacteraceae bacterium]|jgi:hypothetical protein
MSRGESSSPQVTSYSSERLADYIIIVRGPVRVVTGSPALAMAGIRKAA